MTLGNSLIYEDIREVTRIEFNIEHDIQVFYLLNTLGFAHEHYQQVIQTDGLNQFFDSYKKPVNEKWFYMREKYGYYRDYKRNYDCLFMAVKEPYVFCPDNMNPASIPANAKSIASEYFLRVQVHVVEFDESKCNIEKLFYLLKPTKIHGNRYNIVIDGTEKDNLNATHPIHYSYTLAILQFCLEHNIPMFTNSFTEED